MATLAISALGAAIGAWAAPVGWTFLGMSGASIGWSLGSAAGSLIGSGGTTKVEGPRLGDLKVAASTYGIPVPRVYGAYRVAGNMIWSTPIIETRHVNRVRGGKGGGKKVKQISYTYSQSLAVALCEGEISGVRRIWANGALIYNASVTADAATLQASGQIAAGIRVHSGSESQTADSLIQADVGVASCPAYRGTAYAVFENLQLEKYGNRTPNLEFEVVTVSTSALALQSSTSIVSGHLADCFDVTGKYMFVASYTGTTFQIWDVSTPDAPVLASSQTNGNSTVLTTQGPLTFISGNDYRMRIWDCTDPAAPILLSTTVLFSVMGYHVHNGNYIYCFHSSYAYAWVYDISNPRSPTFITSVATGGSGRNAVYGDYFYMAISNSKDIAIWNMATPSAPYKVTTFTVPYVLGTAYISGVAVKGDYLYLAQDQDNLLLVYDLADPVAPVLLASVSTGSRPSMIAINQAGNRLYLGMFGANSIETYDLSNPELPSLLTSTAVGSAVYGLKEAFGMLYATTSSSLLKIYNAGNTLAAVVTDICENATLAAADLDVSLLTDTVEGYAVTRAAARGHLQQLMQAYYFDPVESDGKIKFVPRGAASVATIDADDLAAHEHGSAPPDVISLTRTPDMELPNEYTVNFPNLNAAYSVISQSSQRMIGGSENRVSIDLAVAMSASRGRQVADVGLFDAWTGRTGLDIATSWKYAHLEPTDVVTLTNDGRTYTVRLTNENAAGGIFRRAAVLEDINVYTQTSVGVEALTPDETLAVVPATNLLLLDIPLLQDQDDTIGFYAAASGTNDTWSGAQLYKSGDAGATWVEAGDGFLNPATMGTATTTLGDFTQNIFDEANTVSVYLTSGDLSSDTEINILNGANVALLGNEIIQFKTATLTAANTYTLSGLLRGRQGTEWARSTHTSSDRFVVLDATTTYLLPAPSAEYNVERLYRAATFDSFLDDADDEAFTHTAVARECYSPVQLGGGRDASLNLTINWVRRTRITGGWLDNADVPLGEATESYEVEIYSSNTYVTLKRTITGITSQTTSYSAANQTTDFGSTQATVYFIVYQLSATVGRGYAARGVV